MADKQQAVERNRRMGAALRELRDNRGLPRKTVCENLGVCAATLHTWEAGKAVPREYNLVKLLEFYGYDVTEHLEAIKEEIINERQSDAYKQAAIL